jgi:HEAT repeat protein
MASHPESFRESLEIRMRAVRRAMDRMLSGARPAQQHPGRTPDVDQLTLEFARYLTEQSRPERVVLVAVNARPEVFWDALDSVADGIGGEEWERISQLLRELPEVARERRRLARGESWRRALAARRLGLLRMQEAREELREAMAAGPSDVTLAAAVALARLADLSALEWLLEHPEATARRSHRQLAALLRRFGPDGLPLLRRAIARTRVDQPIHLAAIEAIGRSQDRAASHVLTVLLQHEDVETRIAAARALGGAGDRAAVPALVAALKDEAWQVRAQAARALGSLAAPEAVEPLAALLHDLTYWVRHNAAHAMAELGGAGEAALRAMAESGEDRYGAEIAAEALQKLEWDRESTGGISHVG